MARMCGRFRQYPLSFEGMFIGESGPLVDKVFLLTKGALPMIDFINSILAWFECAFSRKGAFRWFVVSVCGLLTRTDRLGVTSFIRALSIPGFRYDSLIKFSERKERFTKATVRLYGEDREISYYCEDLLWGQKLYRKLRFVLVSCDSLGSRCILVSTDTSMDPLLIIEGYGIRYKIEYMFKEFKENLDGFGYHFWTRSIERIKLRRKKGEPSELEKVTDPKQQQKILKCIEAAERFVFCSCVAQGILQMISLDETMSKEVMKGRYLRTRSKNTVSERSVLDYLSRNFYRLLLGRPDLMITQLIQAAMKAPSVREEHDPAA